MAKTINIEAGIFSKSIESAGREEKVSYLATFVNPNNIEFLCTQSLQNRMGKNE